MATYTFKAADSVTATVPGGVPLTANEPTVIWTSQEYDTTAEGSNHDSLEITVEYEAIDPDTSDPANQPFSFEMAAVVQVKQDSDWVEIGRQNTGIRKLVQGRKRRIIIAPNMILDEEGVDQWVPGLSSEPALIKSRFGESAEGNIRFLMTAVDFEPSGNAFNGVTFSIKGKRYTVAN